MSVPTLTQFAQTMMREFGEDVSNEKLLSQVIEWAQDVYDEIGVQTEWRYLWDILSLNTTIGVRLYNTGNGIDQNTVGRYADTNQPIVYRRKRELIEMGLDLEQSGKPKEFYIEEYDSSNEVYQIGLFPVPDAVYTIDWLGLLRPQELASTDKLRFPREFLFLLKDGVRIKYREDDKNYQGANRVMQRFYQNLNILKAKNNTQLGHYLKMRVMDIPYNDDRLVRLPPEHFRN